MYFAPTAYRETRLKVSEEVLQSFELTNHLKDIAIEALFANPKVLKTLRMCTLPPLARDRLTGLSYTTKSFVESMEERNRISPNMDDELVRVHLSKISSVLEKMLDNDLFPWLSEMRSPSELEEFRAATVVADRLCGAVADPILRNAQEERQLLLIKEYLVNLRYEKNQDPPGTDLQKMTPGTFTFRYSVKAGKDNKVRIPIDVVIVPKNIEKNEFPILIEAKSAGDFTNTNKRRKEEATKIRQLQEAYGQNINLILFLCGYFDTGYLGYEAAEGLDWVWEHRIDDLKLLGL